MFGAVQHCEVHTAEPTRTAGFLQLQRARVRWFLSTDRGDLPEAAVRAGRTTYRSITVNGTELEFSGGFTDLHTRVYEDVLAGGGYGIDDARPAVALAHKVRNAAPAPPDDPARQHTAL